MSMKISIALASSMPFIAIGFTAGKIESPQK
jgi:hypothetical protein